MDRIGKTVSHYRIEEELGAGGMAVVYKAHDLRLRRPVALKFLSRETSEDAAARLLHEAQAASALDHPNICTVYEVAEAGDGTCFIAMAFYEGETLEERLRRGALGLRGSLDIACQVARGLQRAHGHGIVHLDVKPPNLMLTPAGEVKILDFGIAELGDPSAAGGGGLVYGTIPYMSPERLSREEVDARSDIWSLGVVLYEMLTGEPPFRGEDVQELLNVVLLSPPPSVAAPEPAGARLNQVLQQALAWDPDARYGDAEALLRDLEDLERQVAGETRAAPVRKAEPAPSIAVVPFTDLSPGEDQGHLCLGLAEELVRLLTPMPRLRVASVTSAAQSAAQGAAPAEIGRQLRVGTVLTGSVYRDGEHLRVTAQLVRPLDASTMWSERYDRRLEDLFAIQDEIARQIAHALELTLMQVPPAEGPDLGTYTLFLRGRFHWNRRLEEATERGIGYFRRALERDPGHARSWAGLADSYTMQGVYGWAAPGEVLPRAAEAAARALEHDGSLADVYASRGSVRAIHDWAFAAAEADFLQALRLDPTYAPAYQWYAMNALLPQGRFPEALKRLREAQRLDPLSLPIGASVGIFFYYRRTYEKAIRELERTLEIDESFVPAHVFLGHTYAALGLWEDARRAFGTADRLEGGRPDVLAGLGYADAASGANDRVSEMLERLYRLGRARYVAPTLRAQIYTALGRPRAALDALRKGLEIRAADLIWIGVSPIFEPLRGDNDFALLLEMMGLELYDPPSPRRLHEATGSL